MSRSVEREAKGRGHRPPLLWKGNKPGVFLPHATSDEAVFVPQIARRPLGGCCKGVLSPEATGG